MGGYGSGERWQKKRTVEGCWFLDTTTFRRWGWFGSPDSRAGTLGWGAVTGGRHEAEVRYELEIGEDAGSVRLRYELTRSPRESLDYRVPLVTTPCRLGGRRWWFVCSLVRNGQGCGRRARKLFLVGRYFGCRACHDLTYRSRQRSDARAYSLDSLRNRPGAAMRRHEPVRTPPQEADLVSPVYRADGRSVRPTPRRPRNRPGGAKGEGPNPAAAAAEAGGPGGSRNSAPMTASCWS